MLVRTLGDKVELRLDLKPGLPSCTLDPTHLEMALLNVLINARDAMPEGGEVTVATMLLGDQEQVTAHQLPHGNYVVICVKDTGVGMSPEVVRRATEPFFTTKGPGTGLGLAMVHGFVQQSHGRLELESEPGKGTLVRMIFPVADRAIDEAQGEQAADAKDGERVGHACILVVEDNDDVRELAERVLAASGYDVLAAPSGESALALLEDAWQVDLLFTDVIMPGGMNGLQLIERVRALRACRRARCAGQAVPAGRPAGAGTAGAGAQGLITASAGRPARRRSSASAWTSWPAPAPRRRCASCWRARTA
jgi:CheY-like chemotaxis protein/anti-sigma regulatory factor (Ser/Thr protein kinase)